MNVARIRRALGRRVTWHKEPSIPGAVCEFEGACDKDEKTGTCKPEGVAVELCDAIIRILDYLAYMGVDVEAVLMAKHEHNKGREYRHGGKRA